jgi:hypothetical protein
MIKDNPALGQQFLIEMERHKAELLDNMTKAVVWEAQWEQFQQTIGQLVGIFSLTEDPTHVLMWSHYASGHCGVVVEFDDNNFWFNQRVAAHDGLRHLVRVSYVQKPHPLTMSQLTDADVLCTKNAEWAYERAWRMIRPLNGGTEVRPGVFCFDVPGSAVLSIIFGCNTTRDLEQQIRDSVTNRSEPQPCFF